MVSAPWVCRQLRNDSILMTLRDILQWVSGWHQCSSTSCYFLQGLLQRGKHPFLLYSNRLVIFISQWSSKHFIEESKSICYYGESTDFQGTEMRKPFGWNYLFFIKSLRNKEPIWAIKRFRSMGEWPSHCVLFLLFGYLLWVNQTN